MSAEIVIREAVEDDVDGIREIFTASYSDHYAYSQYYDETQLKQLIFDRDIVFLVAEDPDSGRILGTGSVILDIGAWGDLIGEFGRLAVHPDGRGKGIGGRLMEARIDRVKERLHVGIVENRAVHPYSQKISDRHGFTAVGFLPSKTLFAKRENVSLYVRHFGDCLSLRRNHPRIIPEAWAIADEVLRNCGIGCDAIVDDDTPAYALGEKFEIEEMTSEGYTSLLHFERGRVQHREIFGPVKLHAGLFQLRISHYEYLLAKRNGHLVGGIGYFLDKEEKAARILELVSSDGSSIRFLLEEVVERLQKEGKVEYIEVDVSAYSPAMQRSLLELGFLPAAYIPAMTFHRVERLDGIRMLRLFQPLDLEDLKLHEASRSVADLVIQQFREVEVVPRIAAVVHGSLFFEGLAEEQSAQLAGTARIEGFAEGDLLIEQGVDDGRGGLLCSGSVDILVDGNSDPVASLSEGDLFGEMSLLQSTPHHGTAVAREAGELVLFDRDRLQALIRRRPDIGVVIFRNLASQLGGKLLRLDRQLIIDDES